MKTDDKHNDKYGNTDDNGNDGSGKKCDCSCRAEAENSERLG